jgi:methylglutaconyl-CoA hydratase
MAYQHLETADDAGIERLTLNRPDVRNALNETLIAELTDWAAQANERRDLRAVVLAGRGSVFCAGADVAWMAKTVKWSEEDNLRDATATARMFAALDELRVPLVARVHGAALGGGAGLAAVCDIVIADESATFGFTEVKLGIMPAVIAPFVLAKIGPSAARELFLTGARFDAARAHEIGLVHRVVTSAALDAAVDEISAELRTSAPEATASAKRLIRELRGLPAAEARHHSAAAIAARRVSSEGQEGLHAFLEKRRPSWRPDSG